jgi:hypothetical protein
MIYWDGGAGAAPEGTYNYQFVVTFTQGISTSQLVASVTSALVITHPRDRAIFLLMLHSGQRTCEIRSLRFNQLDLDNCQARVGPTKGQGERMVFLSPQTAAALRAYLAARVRCQQRIADRGAIKAIDRQVNRCGSCVDAVNQSLLHNGHFIAWSGRFCVIGEQRLRIASQSKGYAG